MNITILGAGNTGKAYAAYLTQAGHEVILYNRSYSRIAPLKKHGLTASGKLAGTFLIPVTDDLAAAAEHGDLLLVCTVAGGHRPLAEALSGHLRAGQDIVITNGCWGAVEFDTILRAKADEKNVTISEMSGQLILCHSPSPDSVYLKTVKQQIPLACTKPAQTARVLKKLHPVFPQLIPAPNVLHTSLNHSNCVCHGPLTLFNLTRLENGEDYLLFHTCATPRVVRYMERLDEERVNVLSACGVKALTELELLNAFWPDKQTDLYQILHKTPAYAVTKGPKTLHHRYLSEDLPYGLVPYVRLGRKFGIRMPYLETLLSAFCLYMDTDYFAMGPEVEKEDLSRFL
ncbi:MAG: NAD(P)-binding domain-containing protein [Lachnospiraceae bacterium]|nr:NAD(P)-binding domain-containing protein [Lachnospiraceae bacterium]